MSRHGTQGICGNATFVITVTSFFSSKIISEVEVFVGAAAKLAESQNTNKMTPNVGDVVGIACPFDTIPPKCAGSVNKLNSNVGTI